MPTTSYTIKWLEDKLGVRFFPVTHIKSVRDDNGTSIETLLGQKQSTLESGVNIKTINGESILGSGNISVSGGGGGGEPNVIESISINGTGQSVDANKNVDLKIKTINNSSLVGTGDISVGGDTNVIETVKVNGNALTPDSNKAVDVSVPTESTVSGWGFTKNTGTYSKPSGGIPKLDLDTSVQASLDLADTALQSFTETDPIFTASAAYGITSSDITNWNSKTSNVGTITGVSMNGTSIATSGVANITSVPASILIGAIPSAVTAATQALNDNSAKIATTAYVDASIAALPEPMIFKGSLGTGGTITSLPTAAISNTGFTYKVITAGTYASQSAKIGDTFISDGSAWILIPSGDEPSGTVTSITLKANSPISIDSSAAITTSGTRTISHNTSGVSAGTYSRVTVDTYGHVTLGSFITEGDIPGLSWTKIIYDKPTTLSGYGITDAKIANGTITLGSNSITPLTSHQSLAGYLPLSGGTMTGNITMGKNAIVFNQSNDTSWNVEANSGIKILNALSTSTPEGSFYGYAVGLSVMGYYGFQIGISGSETYPYLAYRQIYHSGSGGYWRYLVPTHGASNYDLNELGTYGGMYRHSSAPTNAFANAAYGNTLVVGAGSDTCFQLGAPYTTNELYFRTGTWKYDGTGSLRTSSWRQVAFVNSNVASATKLETARTLWGQNFDGTGNVSGSINAVTNIEFKPSSTANHGGFLDFHYNGSTADYTSRIIESGTGLLTLNNTLSVINNGNVGVGTTSPSTKLDVRGGILLGTNNYHLYVTDTNGNTMAAVGIDSSNYFLLGYGAAHNGYTTLLDGNNIYFRYGTSHTTGMFLNSSGNVGIGTTSPMSKLDVNGTANVNGVINITGILDYSEGIRLHHVNNLSSIWFGAVNNSGYDAGMWGITVGSNGMRFRGAASTTATTPTDYVNIIHGGNVGIGTTSPAYKLDVNGSLRATSFNRNGTTYITSGTPDVPVFDGDVMKYMTLADFAKVVGGQAPILNCNYIARGVTGNVTNEYVVFSVPVSRFSCTLLESSNQHAATYALSINYNQGLAEAKKLTGNNAANILYKYEDSHIFIAVKPSSNWSAVAMFGTHSITLGSNITDVTGYKSVTIS